MEFDQLNKVIFATCYVCDQVHPGPWCQNHLKLFYMQDSNSSETGVNIQIKQKIHTL